MVRRDFIVTEPVAKVVGYTFREAAGVDEYERRFVSFNKVRQPAIDLRPDFIRHHGLKRRTWQLDCQIQFPRISAIYYRTPRVPYFIDVTGPNKESRYLFDRLLGCRQTDALQGGVCEGRQSFHAQRQVRSAAVSNECVYLVHDQRPHGRQKPAGPRRCQQQIEGLRGGHQNVWRHPSDRLPLCCRRIASAHFRTDVHVAAFARAQSGADAGKRFLEILMDVVAQRFERRDIEHSYFTFERSGEPVMKQLIEGSQKRSQRLARAGGRGNERVSAGLNSRPAEFLRHGRRPESLFEPMIQRGMESVGSRVGVWACGRIGAGGCRRGTFKNLVASSVRHFSGTALKIAELKERSKS